MKKLLLFLLVLMCEVCLFAQGGQVAVLYHDNEFKAFYSGSAFADALEAAQPGDVINLSAGFFKGGTITMPLTIRGAGIGSLDSLDNVSTARTIISTALAINIPENTGGHTLSMEGMICEEDLTIYSVTNPIFSKMKLCKSFKHYTTTSILKNITIFQCIIEGTISATSKGNTINIYNSVLNSISSSGSLDLIQIVNCNYKGSSTSSVLQFYNCIVEYSGTTSFSGNCYNCVGISSKNLFTSNNASVDRNNRMFPADQTMFKEGTFYRLTDEAATYLGNDNTQVGIYGSSLPFSPKTSYPQLKKFSVAPESTSDGKLKIEIEIDAD